MPSSAVGRALLIFLSYVALAAAFAWPLPLQPDAALPGTPSGDTGVYVWNLWVFRHEIVVNHASPFFTSALAAAAGAPVPLVLHNYTAFTNLIGLPLLSTLGTVATYNLLILLSHAASATGMYVLASRSAGDRAAGWIAGVIFGFAPFAIARSMGHFSLVQAAPLPLFAWLVIRLYEGASWTLAIAASAVVAWAYYSDPYYAVYCVVMLGCMAAYASVAVRRGEGRPGRAVTIVLDGLLAALAALIAVIAIGGGGSAEVLGARISMRSFYTPVLVLTALAVARALVTLRPRLSVRVPAPLLDWRIWTAGAVTGLALVSPVAYAVLAQGESALMGPQVLWRSSAPGVDLLAMLVPNPFHPLAPDAFRAWIGALPQGLVENTASLPWTAFGVIAIAAIGYRLALPAGWTWWTLWFTLLALGPFVHAAGYNLHVPGPWALLRYVPVIGAARVPTRFSVLVVMGLALVMAIMLAGLRKRVRHPRAVAAAVALLAIFELLPAPRETHAADVPGFLHAIRDDPRPLGVLTLPFGLKDGLVSHGRFSPRYMFHQTVHGKPIYGGYMSRLPGDILTSGEFGRSRVLQTLIALGDGAPVTAADRDALAREGPAFLERLSVGWIVVDRTAAPADLERAAVAAFGLREAASEGAFVLYEPASGR